MTREPLIPDAIIEGPPPITAEAMGAPAQLQLRSILGRLLANELVGRATAEAIWTATVGGEAKASALRAATQPHEAGLRAINDNVARAAGIGVNNAAMLILQEVEATRNESAAIGRRGRERLATMPDAAFVKLTLGDRVGAVMRGTYAELELRPGTPRLTLWQDIRQLVVGGVVERICDEYDRRQIAERKAELARAIAHQMALLEARVAAAGLAGTATASPEESVAVDEDAVSRLIDEVLARSRNGTANGEYAYVEAAR